MYKIDISLKNRLNRIENKRRIWILPNWLPVSKINTIQIVSWHHICIWIENKLLLKELLLILMSKYKILKRIWISINWYSGRCRTLQFKNIFKFNLLIFCFWFLSQLFSSFGNLNFRFYSKYSIEFTPTDRTAIFSTLNLWIIYLNPLLDATITELMFTFLYMCLNLNI